MANPEPQDEPTVGPVTVPLHKVKPEAVRWLWPGRIPLGKLTLIVGDPALGKSFISMDIASRLSTGRPWPDDIHAGNPAGSVILLNAEDDLPDTIRPRLDAAQADVRKITALQAVRHCDPELGDRDMPFSLACDLQVLDHLLTEIGDVKLVIVDPLSAYLGSIDGHKNAEVRGLLAPLAELACRHRVAVVCISHLNKATGSAMYRATGSLAFVAACRAVWAVAKDKDDGARRLVLPIKNNLAPDTVGGLAYRLHADAEGEIPVVAWEAEPIRTTADEALDRETGQDRTERDEARQWLREILEAGPLPAKEIKRAALDAGLAWITIRRAKGELGVISQREGFGPGGAFTWNLNHRGSPDPHTNKVSTQERERVSMRERERERGGVSNYGGSIGALDAHLLGLGEGGHLCSPRGNGDGYPSEWDEVTA